MTSSNFQVDNTTRKRFNLKETSLLEDFEEASVKLSPPSDVIPIDVRNIETRPGLGSLEKDFADTADTFKIVSVNVHDGKNGASQEAEKQVLIVNATTISAEATSEASTIGVSTTPEIVEISTIIVKAAK